jgi:hypothetical protein
MTTMPLTGIRVLDLTRLLPGPFCTLLLGDMGADVIKIEEPESGDYMRWTPPLIEGQSALFNAVNRNKRSITLNLKTDAGRELLLQLVDSADVLVEGNRPGVMDRLGLGWDVLHERNPKLVTCSITGYGQDGPYALRADTISTTWPSPERSASTASGAVRPCRWRSRSQTSEAADCIRRSRSWARCWGCSAAGMEGGSMRR